MKSTIKQVRKVGDIAGMAGHTPVDGTPWDEEVVPKVDVAMS